MIQHFKWKYQCKQTGIKSENTDSTGDVNNSFQWPLNNGRILENIIQCLILKFIAMKLGAVSKTSKQTNKTKLSAPSLWHVIYVLVLSQYLLKWWMFWSTMKYIFLLTCSLNKRALISTVNNPSILWKCNIIIGIHTLLAFKFSALLHFIFENNSPVLWLDHKVTSYLNHY